MSHTDSECPFCDCGQDALWHFCACPAVQAIREAFFPRLRGEFDDPFFLLFALSNSTHTSAGKAAFFSAGLLMDALYVSRATIVHSPHIKAPLESLVRGRLRQLARAGGLLRRRILHVTRQDLLYL